MACLSTAYSRYLNALDGSDNIWFRVRSELIQCCETPALKYHEMRLSVHEVRARNG
jgi:hypothetical protein